MSSSVSRDHGMFEWASNGLVGMFCQPSRLLDPGMWRLFYDILRFNACARRLVINSDNFEDYSVAEYLAREGYSDTFRDDYLVPMTAAIWGAPLEMPVKTLVAFMSNHRLLQLTGNHAWLTIKGGSRQYVDAILERLPKNQLHLSTPIASVGNVSGGTQVQVTTADGRALNFDRVIMACHSDTTLGLLRAGHGTTQDEERILGRFSWTQNETVLHHDTNLMPKSLSAWSAWNYLTFSAPEGQGMRKTKVNKVSLTYNMNLLQNISPSEYGPVLVTLNPPVEPASGTVAARFQYDHPVLDREAITSMREMHKIQGHRGILYAGAWLGYGFHEDGFTSGLSAVANHIDGVKLPFKIAFSNGPVREVLAAHVFDVLEWTRARDVLGRILSFLFILLSRLVLIGSGREHGSK